MKNLKYKFINMVIIVLLIQIINLLVFNCISIATTEDIKDTYDVILFWGQSNMTGYCGLYDAKKAKENGTKNETERDKRYEYWDSNSVNNYSKKTGIDKEFLANSVQMNWVKISQEKNTVFDYNYENNKLIELNENTQKIGELLKYDSGSKKLIKAEWNDYSIQKSYGTNIVPQFCKTYYQKTGHKVVCVLAGNGGEQIANFLPSTDEDYGEKTKQNKQMIYEAMVEKYKAAIKHLESNGYTVKNKMWVSFQGEADANRGTEIGKYKDRFLKVHNGLKKDLNITKGVIIETSTLLEKENYNSVININNAQIQLAAENNDIILGSSYAYDRFIPDKKNYKSIDFNSKIYLNNNGSKIDYDNALNIAKLSMCDPPNTIHFTSAALCQIGKETANLLADSFNKPIKPDLKITEVNPSDAVNYQILAKDNSDIMFQTIQNTTNSNLKLYSNYPPRDESLFRFKKISDNQYIIISRRNSLVISAKDNTNNSKLILAKQNQADKKQIWKIIHNSNGTVAFVNVATGKAIQPEKDTQKMSYYLIQSTYVQNKRAQSFLLYSDEVRIQTTDIRVYLPNNNSEMGKIDFNFAVTKIITEKDVINNTKTQIYNEVKKKLTSIGLKDGEYKISMWKDNSNSIADDLLHYYIKVELILPDNTLEKNSDNYTKVDPCEVVNYKILSKDSSYVMFQNTQNNVNSNVRLYINVPSKDESLYRFKKISNVGYMIISKKNSFAISAKDYNNNSKLILAKQNQADKKQIWKIVHNSNGTVAFVNVATGKAIQPEKDKQNIKHSLIQSTYVNNKNAQSFYLYSDEVRIQTTDIRVYLPNSNSEMDKIDFSFVVNKKITEKDVIDNTKIQIYNEVKKKLTSIGLKDGEYKISMWKDNSHSIADDLLHYYIKVELVFPDNSLESNPANCTKVDPCEVVNYKILSKDSSYVMFQNTQNNVNSNVRLYINVPSKDESLYRFKKISNIGYMIISKKNSLAISAKDYNNNSKLILAKQNQADKKQIWRIVHNSNGTVAFVNVATGKAIQPEQDKQNVKNSLIQSTYVNNKNAQSFYLYSDEVRIQTTDIRVYLPNSDSENGKIDFSFAVTKKITEKDVIDNTKTQIYNEVKKKLISKGLKDGEYKIIMWKDNSHSIADDLIHYYIRVNIIPQN